MPHAICIGQPANRRGRLGSERGALAECGEMGKGRSAPSRPWLLYAVAPIAVTVAAALKLAAGPILYEGVPFLLFFGAVMASAWVGGFRVGVVATGLAALVADFLFLPPYFRLVPVNGAQAWHLWVFAAEALAISGFGGQLHRIAQRAQRAERDAQRANRESADRLAELEGFFDVAPIGLAIASADPAVPTRANAAALRILDERLRASGVPAGSTLPPYRALSDGLEVSAEELPMRRAARTRVAQAEVLEIVHDGGARVPVLATATPLLGADGAVRGVVGGFIDLTLLRRAEGEARESEQRFRIMADTTPVMIWVLDRDRRCSYVNRAWLAFTGRTLAQELGDGWTDSLHPDDREACLAELAQAAAERVEFRLDYRLRSASGDYRWVHGIGAPRTGTSGAFVGFVGSCIDISERRRVDEEREAALARETAARSEAERANRLKDEFLATISHELRTPLNAILGWARLLSRPELSAVQRERASETIARNAVAQARIIDDILDASRIVTGKLRLEVRPLADLASVVSAAVDTVRPAAEAKRIELRCALDPYAEPVLADAERIQQMVWNLCSNAVKFTPAGGRIEVSLASGDGAVEIRVADTGEGIAPGFLPYVFDRFRQADASTTRRHGGLGLGLAIARHLTELHGGTIMAESEGIGCGAAFVVRLPVIATRLEAGAAAVPATARSVEEPAWSRLDDRLVVVVDDDPDALETMRAVLHAAGAQVVTAGSAEEALAALDLGAPDLLISDIGMPGRDGYWLIRQVRSRGGDEARVPAIALTAYTRREDRARSLAEGYQAHLNKPVEPSELLAVAASVFEAAPASAAG
jgi:PAS domain S-box-containing protein